MQALFPLRRHRSPSVWPRIVGLAGLLAAAGCATGADPAANRNWTIGVAGSAISGAEAWLDAYFAGMPRTGWQRGAGDLQVELQIEAPLCDECWRLDPGTPIRIAAGGPLGLQYGLSEVLEAHGWRFPHPLVPHEPATLAAGAAARLNSVAGPVHAPQAPIRGLHLHTLHPIEGLYAMWEPGAANLEHALQIVDWTVKQRGNLIQWVALADILAHPRSFERWQRHTRAIVDTAHARGMKVGMNVLVFGESSLQNAYTLLDGGLRDRAQQEAQIRERVQKLVRASQIDLLNLSYGEFFGSDPAAFVELTNEAFYAAREVRPGITATTTIHVGNFEDLRVEFGGREQQYYFLARYADPEIVPWVHTVMYYNLFDDAGGAYNHDEFDEHRAFLLERMDADEPIGYFPETAYWIAFDNSVPSWLPIYVRSRWVDLHHMAAHANGLGRTRIPDQVLFSTGWEWGFWLHDAIAMRMAWEVPDDPRELIREMYEPLAAQGAALGELVADAAELQYEALIGRRLAPWLAGRDFYLDLGWPVRIFSQPERPLFHEVPSMTVTERTELAEVTLPALLDLAAAHDALAARAAGIGPGADPRYLDEVRDGLAVNAERLRYIAALYRGVLRETGGGSAEADFAIAAEARARAEAIVARRHANLWHPQPWRLLDDNLNPTIYPFGYLKQAHSLCLWEREWNRAGGVIGRDRPPAPDCIF